MAIELNINLKFIDDTLGISCVEKQLIAIMRYYKLDYKLLFIDSFIDLSNTIKDFYNNKLEYAYYKGLDRLQYTCKLLSIGELKYKKIEVNQLEAMVKKYITNKKPVLICVDPLKIKQPGQIDIPWRREHYVCAYGFSDNSISVIDDFPKRKLDISLSEIKDAYLGTIVIFNKLNNINTCEYNKRLMNKMLKITNMPKIDTENIDCLMPENVEELQRLRDALVIVKISRQRLQLLISYINETINFNNYNEFNQAIDNIIELLSKVYYTTEYYRIRNKINNQYLKRMLRELISYENNWIDNIKLLMREIPAK